VGGGALVRGLAAIALAAGAAACSSTTYRLDRRIERAGLTASEVARHRSLVAEGDRLWAARSDPARLAEALGRWEQALALKDDDWRTYERLARGYFFQADSVFGFAASGGTYPFPHGANARDPAAERRFRDTHRRGYIAALRGLAARSREFEARLQGGVGMDRSVRVLGRDSAALLYWYVSNLGRWARGAGVGTLLRSRTAVLACLYHLRKIDPRYFHAGADRLLGVYYAAAPGIVGGDLGKSRAHFEAALRAAPAYLGTAVLAAEFLDRKAHDRASFEARLRAVLSQVHDAAPDLEPENDVERRKARSLLERVDSYFPP
jgi:hypothetical protein